MPDAPASLNEKSLQINITSIQDARSVVRHLQEVRDAYIAYGCTSIELAVYRGLENDMQVKDLSQNFRWCKTYRRIVAPLGGNVMWPVPHFEEEAWSKVRELGKLRTVLSNRPVVTPTEPIKRGPGRPRLEPASA